MITLIYVRIVLLISTLSRLFALDRLEIWLFYSLFCCFKKHFVHLYYFLTVWLWMYLCEEIVDTLFLKELITCIQLYLIYITMSYKNRAIYAGLGINNELHIQSNICWARQQQWVTKTEKYCMLGSAVTMSYIKRAIFAGLSSNNV